jgi:hypothetical protein
MEEPGAVVEAVDYGGTDGSGIRLFGWRTHHEVEALVLLALFDQMNFSTCGGQFHEQFV